MPDWTNRSGRTPSNASLALALFALLLAGLASPAASQPPPGTVVGGGTVSGTWDLAGSPYILQGDVTVPAGETLTVEPGVVVYAEAAVDARAP